MAKLTRNATVFFRVHSKILTYAVLILAVIIAGYYFYVQVYSTAITPKEIDTNTIASKKQKVNLDLFNKVIAGIQKKQHPMPLDEAVNPFGQ